MNNSDVSSIGHLLGYFDPAVLASYRQEPHKYEITTDDFNGSVETTTEHYYDLEAQGRTSDAIHIRFGYRTLKDGKPAIVGWIPDLERASLEHRQKWVAFQLKNPEWTTEYDERFDKWVQRYIEGSWNVDNGPLPHLVHVIEVINALTSEIVGIPLYKHGLSISLSYPAAENTHRYQDAHEELYGYLVDGIDKQCIDQLASHLNRSINISSDKTLKALSRLFPALDSSSDFQIALDTVSSQRWLAAHGKRPPAADFHAFSQFTHDLEACLKGVNQLLTLLEQELGVDGERAYKRHEAKKLLPQIVRPPEEYFSITQALQAEGKTIDRIELGSRKDDEEVHSSETLIFYFTDGSIMGLDTGSNAWNLTIDDDHLQPSDFHVDFNVTWVPSLR